MDPISIAGMVIAGASEIIKLANSAVQAARAGNEAEALRLLDEAMQIAKVKVGGLVDALEEVKQLVEKAIADKFHGGVQP
jgi:hypothetical protein